MALRMLAIPASVVASVALASCSQRIGYEPEYVPAERPPFVAQSRLLIVMPEEQFRYAYEGAPESAVGDFTTLEVPIGEIVADIARDVFGSCFARGVVFADDRFGDEEYVIALEGDLESFLYSYTRVIEMGFEGQQPDVWIVPQVQISFAVKAYDAADRLLLDRTYDGGIVAGKAYRTTMRPSARINEALHATLHALMLEVAADLRPFLLTRCEVEERPAAVR